MQVVVTDTPGEADRAAVLDGLAAFNAAAVGPSSRRPFAALVKDAGGATLGGAIGFSSHGWLYVDHLFLPEALRGQGLGARVMARVEEEARARGCVGLHLRTASFQAPRFYEGLGFVRVGALPGHPPGHADFWYAKRLDGALIGDS